MNRIRIGRPRARSGHRRPGGLPPDPPDRTSSGPRARADRAFRKRRPGNDRLGRQAPIAGCPDGDPRGHDGPPRADAHVGMPPAHQRGGRCSLQSAAALGSVAGRLPARREPPAGPGTRPKQGGNPGLAATGQIRASAPPADLPRTSRAAGPSPAAARTRRQVRPAAPARQHPVLAIGDKRPGMPPGACSSPGCTPAVGRAPWQGAA